MITLDKAARRYMVDSLAQALGDCTSEYDRLPRLIVKKYGDKRIGTSIARLSGNCEVVYDFAEREFGYGEWITGAGGRRHYAGDAPLSAVLPYVWQEGEDEPREMPEYAAEWNGYEYVPVITGWTEDYDNPITTRGEWAEYSGNIARAIAAVVVSLVIRHAEEPPPETRGYLLQEWFIAELQRPLPERRIITADEWLRGFDGWVSHRGYPTVAAIGNLLPWQLSDRTIPASAVYPLPPNQRRLYGALPAEGYHSLAANNYDFGNPRYTMINQAFYTLRDSGQFVSGSPRYHEVRNMHYGYQDRQTDDRAAIIFLRERGAQIAI